MEKKKMQFLHCLMAIVGRTAGTGQSGSEYYNYRRNFSNYLLGVADTDYCFLFADFNSSRENKLLKRDRRVRDAGRFLGLSLLIWWFNCIYITILPQFVNTV